MRSLLVSCALVAALLTNHAAAQEYYKYQVSIPIRHPSCSSPKLSMDKTQSLAVTRGVPDAPCTGYLKFTKSGSKRICTTDGPLPRQEMAQRACYTLGTNMYRPENFDPAIHTQIMLFICDIYTEFGVDEPEANNNPVTSAQDIPIGSRLAVGKQCTAPPAEDDFCFKECYLSIFVGTQTETDCLNAMTPNPFWATTGIDVDECQDGVLADCTGPFPDSCTKRKACGDNTVCTNVANATGGWLCDCMEGYSPSDSGDHFYMDCEDIDECGDDDDDVTDEDLCGYHAQCINTPGSYICTCLRPELYDSGTRKCEKSECPAPPDLEYGKAELPIPDPEFGATVTYECQIGYQVEQYGVTMTPPPYYTYDPIRIFVVKCMASGQWDPYPMPICSPISCKDPGDVLNAQRFGANWNYKDEVEYICMAGYRPKKQSYDVNGFKMTCNSDGNWGDRTTCEDIDECKERPGICGVVGYCLNTIGSYMCLDGNIPSLNPCDLMNNLGLCMNGNCYMESGQATCRCFNGYEGIACDRPMASAALVIAIVGLVLAVVALVLVIIVCCQPLCRRPAVQRIHPKTSSMQPVYGGYNMSPNMQLMYPG